MINKSIRYFYFSLAILFVLFGISISSQDKNILIEQRTIELPKVQGRIDHMSIDVKSERLFIAALGNGTVEIIDLKSGKTIHSITGLQEPQGVLYYPKNKLLFVASGGDGTCKIYNTSDFKLLKIIQLGGDADNIRYDKQRDIVFVGFGSGGIAAIKPAGLKLIYKIALPAHPESFQIDESNGLIFVNIPNTRELDEINIDEKKVTHKINLDVRGNFPMALDTLNNLIFIGSRNPSKLILLSANSLKIISDENISGDADDIFCDRTDSLIFVSCGSGDLDIFKQISPGEITLKESIKTSPGARTSLYVPVLNKIFIAARKYDGSNAKVLEYSIQR